MELITMPETMIVGVTLLLVTCHSGGHVGSTHGIRVASTIAFWTIRELQTWWASRALQGEPFCLMRIPRVLSSASTLT